MRVRFWGTRGSVPVADERMLGYGGNTSCVEITLDDGTEIILDAGTGIRALGLARSSPATSLTVLLTHLHLDHIQGLLFFAPLFDPGNDIVVYGPPAPGPSLDDRLARYLSEPLSPVDLRDLPARVRFSACPFGGWQIGPARVEAALVAHRGLTLGYRITEGERSVCYLPDHEPALGAPIDRAAPGWISGLGLAAGADLLIHDAQFGDGDYVDHVGWGHSGVSDALAFARCADVPRVVLTHHDPSATDEVLDARGEAVRDAWAGAGRDAASAHLAAEGTVLTV